MFYLEGPWFVAVYEFFSAGIVAEPVRRVNFFFFGPRVWLILHLSFFDMLIDASYGVFTPLPR